MRIWATLGLVLTVTCSQACSASTVATTSPAASLRSSPTAQTSTNPGPINEAYQPVSGCPAQPAYSGLAYGILVSQTPAADGTYSIAMVNAAGHVVARAAYHPREALNVSATVPDGTPMFTPAPIRTSNSRLYYLDGDNDVHSLAPDGTTGIATRLPGDTHVRSTFAVSPDDRRIAVSVLDYSKSPPSLRLYVEDLGSGTNHVEIFSSTRLFVWPVGWHSCQLVVGVGEKPIAGDLSDPFNPYGATSYHVVDAATGNRLATIGDASCKPTGPLDPAGTACASGEYVSVLDWTGRATLTGLPDGGGGVWGAAVDPGGVNVAICCSMAGLFLNIGGAMTYHEDLWGWPMWIDEDHLLVSGSVSTAQPHPALRDTSGRVSVVDASGYVFATIPGSL